MANIVTRAAAVLVTAALAVALSGGRAAADSYSLFFNRTFGDPLTPPSGSAPWLTAVFEDVGVADPLVDDYVRLTLAAPGLDTGEFAAEWYFNVGGNDEAEETTIGLMAVTHLSGQVGTPEWAQNAYQAGPDGKFDLLIDFPRGQQQPKRLLKDQTSVYKLTGVNVAGLRNRFSLPAASYGPFLAAAKIQGIGDGNEGSAWVYATREPPPSVSEAGALQFAVFAGLGALALMRRRRA